MGSSSMANQIMIGFFAWAESVDIRVDERELAGWGGLGFLLDALAVITESCIYQL